jgi:hypothetical protein
VPVPAPQQRRAVSAYYSATVTEFLATAPATVIGTLAMADVQGALDAEQRRAWEVASMRLWCPVRRSSRLSSSAVSSA